MAKTRRNKQGQFRHSWFFHFAPLLYLIVGIIALYILQLLFTEDELISPYVSHYTVGAYEGIVVTILEVKQPEPKFATVTAYSCIGITDKYHLEMNCPSLKYSPRGRTSNGTEPVPYKTMACDRANMGKTFELEGIGQVKCTDTGGAIKGEGRFDLYVGNISEAYKWGKQQIHYKEI